MPGVGQREPAVSPTRPLSLRRSSPAEISSEHGYHHVLGSVPQALERHDHFPVIVIP